MTLRLSTGLRNGVLDTKAEAENLQTSTTAFSFTAAGGSSASGSTLVASGSTLSAFRIGDNLTIAGSANGGTNGSFEMISTTSGIVEVASGSFTTEAASPQIIIATSKGGSYVDLFRNCVIDIYSGSQPATADLTESGTKLVHITLASGTFVASSPANGLNFGVVAAGVLAKETGEVWSGIGLDDGTAGWFRIYDNSYTTGASSTAIRLDGAVATSGSQFNMSSTTVVTAATTTVDSVALTQPAA